MIEFLRGRLVRQAPLMTILDVGGVGFRIQVPGSTSEVLTKKRPGDEVELRIVMSISPNDASVRLYGFLTEGERQMFELLTQVKGVGPGTAARILSGANAETLRAAIMAGDSRSLTRVKGIGKKTAERIVFDLREKITLLGDVDMSLTEHPAVEEALLAMTALGYDLKDTRKAVDKAVKALGEDASSEDLVRKALGEV